MLSNRNSSLLVGMQNGTATLENTFFQVKRTCAVWSSICAPWYLPRECENFRPHKGLHVDVTAALFIIAKAWKQPRCPSIGEWIKYGVSRRMDYYSALERNELSSHEKTQRKPKCVLPNERSHSEKATCYMILVYDILGKANYGDNIKIRGCQGLVEGAEGRARRISRAVKLLGMIL